LGASRLRLKAGKYSEKTITAQQKKILKLNFCKFCKIESHTILLKCITQENNEAANNVRTEL
jgi:hypothetical protein